MKDSGVKGCRFLLGASGMMIVALAGQAHRLLADPRGSRSIRIAFAIALVALAIMLALRQG